MNASCILKRGKFNLLIDGQYGSTGKGLFASYISRFNKIDLAIGRISPNAGHTFYSKDVHSKDALVKYVTRQLPVSGILNKNSIIFLSAGSVIDTEVLRKEIDYFNIDSSRLYIHPRAAVITKENLEEEKSEMGVIKIASTQTGTGAARASKIMRKGNIAANDPYLQQFTGNLCLEEFDYLNILVETSQGFDLGLNFGFQYPNCSSSDVIPSAVLADLGAHPNDLGNVIMTVRAYPIRVGNIVSDRGETIGYSGDVYSDSKELSWKELGVEPEYTSVSHRMRRIFTFSLQQYRRALSYIRPDVVFLNFLNYARAEELPILREAALYRKPDFVGYGPTHFDIISYSSQLE